MNSLPSFKNDKFYMPVPLILKYHARMFVSIDTLQVLVEKKLNKNQTFLTFLYVVQCTKIKL